MFAPEALKKTVLPGQATIGPELIVIEGEGMTETVIAFLATQIEESLPDNVYTVVAMGLMTICGVLKFPGDQV